MLIYYSHIISQLVMEASHKGLQIGKESWAEQIKANSVAIFEFVIFVYS